jgi:hypothetical protein
MAIDRQGSIHAAVKQRIVADECKVARCAGRPASNSNAGLRSPHGVRLGEHKRRYENGNERDDWDDHDYDTLQGFLLSVAQFLFCILFNSGLASGSE